MKTLVSVSFVVDVDDFDDLSQLIQTMEESAGDAFRKALADNSSTWDELSEVFEFYGISASPIRETVA